MSFGLAQGPTDLLLCRVDWHSLQHNQTEAISQEISNYQPDKLLNTSDDMLTAYFQEKYQMDVPALDRDAITVDQHEKQIDVS